MACSNLCYWTALRGKADVDAERSVIEIDLSRSSVTEQDNKKSETCTAPTPGPLLVNTIGIF
jgi:hypothetical protein